MKLFLFILTSCLLFGQEVYVNQVGYDPLAPKTVYASNYTGSFKIADINGIEVYSGEFIFKGTDEHTNLSLSSADVSDFMQTGEYKIVLDNSVESNLFLISENVYTESYRKALKSFYMQRCGIQLTQNFAGQYHHLKCHSLDAFYHQTAGTGFKLTTGGWHDAGDFGKYIVNAGVTVGTMLFGYELLPENFQADNLNIPESGNGIPDFLDEIKYEVDWFLKMQNDEGAVFFKCTAENFSGVIMPEADNSSRNIYELSSTATADFAAITAMFSRIFRQYDEEYSGLLLNASEQAWNYLISNPNIFPIGGFTNPPGTGTGQYGDGNDKDERLWAAIELLKTTGKQEYSNYFDLFVQDYFNNSFGWNDVKSLALLSYMFENQYLNRDVLNELEISLISRSQEILQKANSNGFSVPLSANEYNWGNNSTILNRCLMLYSAYKITSNESYLIQIQNSLNYIFGCNGHNKSFVTGCGANYPMHIHHRQSEADNIEEPVPGLIAGGPDRYLSDPVLKARFNSNTPPAMCYTDEFGSYASNEIAINWNAPLVTVLGIYNSIFYTSSIEEGKISIPEEIKILGNYPNPFNGFTRIDFRNFQPQNLFINIFNILGEKVLTKDLGYITPGDNSISLDYSEIKNPVSGVYFYNIAGNQNSDIQKMIIIK